MKIAIIIAISLISSIAKANGFPYVAALSATTLVSHEIGSDTTFPVKDISPIVGLGYMFNDTVFVEADICPTFVEGDYVSFGAVISYGWMLNRNFYSATRFLTTITPDFGIVWIPALGYTYAFSNGFAPFVEAEGSFVLNGSIGGEYPMNLKGSIVGIGIAAGATYAF